MSSNDNLLNKLENFKKQYYSENTKNTFFKKQQKMDFAQNVKQQFPLEELIAKTMYILPNTNMIYIDYPVFKMYGHPDVYNSVIDYIQVLIDNCLQKYGSYSVHVNLNSFTISAAERYRAIVDLFYAKTVDKYTLYFNTIEHITIYYTPNSISEIIKIFLPNEILPKLKLINKTESPAKINELFASFQAGK